MKIHSLLAFFASLTCKLRMQRREIDTQVDAFCHRIMQEIAGTWKQYSDLKLSGFFSLPEYCFHKLTGITQKRPFPGRAVRHG